MNFQSDIMIKTITNKEDIISLWSEAFGDTRDEILYFVDNVKNAKCIGAYETELESMLFLVDCKLNNINSKYIYAACTKKSSQGKGYMTMLLDYCKKEYDSVCLIPANTGLISYYKNRGLDIKDSTDSIKFDEIDGIVEYLFEGCELEQPIILEYRG